MRLFLFLTIFLAIASACKKESTDPEPTSPSASFTLPSTTGSYWIYAWSSIDSLGNVTPLSMTDTIRITGDSLVNGQTYTVYHGTYMGSVPYAQLLRDSSGYIVTVNGAKLYSYVNAGEVLGSNNIGEFDLSAHMGTPTILEHPLGTFEVLDHQRVMTSSNGGPVNACWDLSYTFHTYYASGIGEIRYYDAYLGPFQSSCKVLRRDLTEYYIAP